MRHKAGKAEGRRRERAGNANKRHRDQILGEHHTERTERRLKGRSRGGESVTRAGGGVTEREEEKVVCYCSLWH